MITRILVWLCACLLFAGLHPGPVAYADTGPASTPPAPLQGAISITYHDVGKVTNAWTVSPSTLNAHFAYIKNNGYHPISLEQYLASMRDGSPLPPKAILLTFDDGYESFYTEVFPLLKKYNFPAVMAIITSWLEGYAPPDAGPVLTWNQLREMESSGLVTVASHSHQAHRYVVKNPQGDLGTSIETLIYQQGRYETPAAYHQRIEADFRHSQYLFEKELGHTAKALVWPYGAYTKAAREIGESLGFEVFFRLEGGLNTPGKAAIYEAKRGIIMDNPTVGAFARYLQNDGKESKPLRAAQLDLDAIYDENPRQLALNVKLAIERLKQAGVNTVFLQAFSDSNGDGNIESVYFHTTAAPVKADIFSHVTSRLQEQGFRVFAWMPTLASQWLIQNQPEDQVTAYDAKGKGWYNRASPFSDSTCHQLEALFRDLTSYTYITGILLQDDLYLTDYEDFSPPAKTAFFKEFQMELTPEVLKDDAVKERWTQVKTEALNTLTERLIAVSREARPQTLAARNLYPIVITDPKSEEWFAQNYQRYLELYDYTVIMAYPYMEKQNHRSGEWLSSLAAIALRNPTAASKAIFKLQTYDWSNNVWLAETELRSWQRILKEKGAIHFAYYPENVFAEQ